METKTDPFSGEEFIPKRRNQKFATQENKVAFNNDKAAKIREERAQINNVIKRNHEILKLLLNNEKEKTVDLKTLDDLSFKFNYYLKLERINHKSHFSIYDINYTLLNNENKQIKIYKS
jgi:hypothetical protein